MIDIRGAKIDILKGQSAKTLEILAKKLEINKDDLEFKLGAELEFYIKDNNKLTLESEKIKEIINNLMVAHKHLRVESFEEEDGYNQFEVQFVPTDDPCLLARNIIDFRHTMHEFCDVDFRAKPNLNDAGSSLHFHISIYYKGNNLFTKENPLDDDEYHYLPLYWSIAGMLKYMMPAMRVFAPTENCYERYLYPKKTEKNIHYPTCVCWGFNNRTCAIRIPKKPTEDPYNCRIEHRVCSSVSDPYLDLFCIFAGMSFGIQDELECPEPTFGNAFDTFHDYLAPLPKTFEDAEKLFKNGVFNKLGRILA